MIKRELAIFLVVGATTVLLDFVSYRGLVEFEMMAVDIAKATGFLIGTLFAYFANRFWTFGHRQQFYNSAWRFVVLYASTLAANVMINSLALKLFVDATAVTLLAFFVATGVSATLNFLGMKFFVFRPIPASEFQ